MRPVKLLRDVMKRIPELSKIVNLAYALREQFPPEQWPDWCFIPRTIWIYVSEQFSEEYNLNTPEARHFATLVYTLCCWRYGQGIYEFDPDTFDALVKSDSPGTLPADVLLRLPEWCIYIPTPGLRFYGEDLSGFFAMVDSSGISPDDAGTPCLLITADAADSMMPIPIPLINCNIEEAIKKTLSAYDKKLNLPGADTIIRDHSALAESLTPLISLLLYICSETPEIDNQREPGTSPFRILPKKVKGGFKLFPANGPTVFKVGQKIGETLRKTGYSAPRTDATTGHHRRPHLRRGHWHGYWIGPRKSGEQKFKYNWLPPIMVAANIEDESSTHKADE